MRSGQWPIKSSSYSPRIVPHAPHIAAVQNHLILLAFFGLAQEYRRIVRKTNGDPFRGRRSF
jgi:hypothetical protein